jgi:hypothetical protein
VRRTHHEILHHKIFSSLILILPLWFKIFFSIPSQTPSVYAPPLMRRSYFHTHTKQQAKLYLCIFNSYIFSKANRKTKDSGMKSGRHSLNLNCLKFLQAYNFDTLVSLSNIYAGTRQTITNTSLVWLLQSVGRWCKIHQNICVSM